MYIYTLQTMQKISSSYLSRAWKESTQKFCVLNQVIQRQFEDLWVKTSKYVFLFFRTLSWFLPDWIVCRLESYTGYIRYAHLQNRQLVVEQKRKKELVKIQTNYEKKLKVEKKKTLELQKEIKEVWEEKHKKIDQELLNLREELRRIQLAAR